LELVSGAGNVNPMSDEERDTIEMCTDVAGARLGCQLSILGDVTIRAVD
jgi:ferredoxin